jgi:peroxiredoxin
MYISRVLLLAVIMVFAAAPVVSAVEPGIAATDQAVKPIAVGDSLPTVSGLQAVDGTATTLAGIHGGKGTVLIFFRGGWCPICTKHLSGLKDIEGDVKAAGYQMAAIATDTAANLAAASGKHSIPVPLYADPDLTAASALGLAFVVDDQTVVKYKGFGIPLLADGQGRKVLPVPAVIVVDPTGAVKFVHFDPDFRKRLEPKAVLKAVKAAEVG